jgi:hypothetical protein
MDRDSGSGNGSEVSQLYRHGRFQDMAVGLNISLPGTVDDPVNLSRIKLHAAYTHCECAGRRGRRGLGLWSQGLMVARVVVFVAVRNLTLAAAGDGGVCCSVLGFCTAMMLRPDGVP